MDQLVTCDILTEALKESRSLGVDETTLYSVAILRNMGYGRVAIARYLGKPERLIRSLIEELKYTSKFIHLHHLLGEFTWRKLESKGGSCIPVIYSGFSSEVLDAVVSRVVELRDYIVIHAKNPWKIEVIGVIKNGVVHLPGIPSELARTYLELFSERVDGIIVCWREYRDIQDDALLLVSLGDVCKAIARQ